MGMLRRVLKLHCFNFATVANSILPRDISALIVEGMFKVDWPSFQQKNAPNQVYVVRYSPRAPRLAGKAFLKATLFDSVSPSDSEVFFEQAPGALMTERIDN